MVPAAVSKTSSGRRWFACPYCGAETHFAGPCPSCRDAAELDPLGPVMHRRTSEAELLGELDLQADDERGTMPG